MKKLPVLSSKEVRERVVENAHKQGDAAFKPTLMAVAFVEAAVR